MRSCGGSGHTTLPGSASWMFSTSSTRSSVLAMTTTFLPASRAAISRMAASMLSRPLSGTMCMRTKRDFLMTEMASMPMTTLATPNAS